MEKEFLQDNIQESDNLLTAKRVLISAGIILGSVGCFLLSSIIGSKICKFLDISGYKGSPSIIRITTKL